MANDLRQCLSVAEQGVHTVNLLHLGGEPHPSQRGAQRSHIVQLALIPGVLTLPSGLHVEGLEILRGQQRIRLHRGVDQRRSSNERFFCVMGKDHVDS